jgi:predicted murein hydrolase (TIGR00659 family)
MVESPSFYIAITVVIYYLSLMVSNRYKHPLTNPTLLAGIIIYILLLVLKIPIEKYSIGGNTVQWFLGPATVALGVTLYKQWDQVKVNFKAILAGVFAGSFVGIASTILLVKALGGSREIAVTLAPKSVTTPIAIEISRMIGGFPPITAGAVIITGLLGAVFGPEILKLVGVKNPIAIGIAIGTSAHGLGTSRAVEEGEVEGAMSGLSIGFAGVITAFIIAFLVRVLL